MSRFIFTLLSALSLVLLLVTSVAWGRSYWRRDHYRWFVVTHTSPGPCNSFGGEYQQIIIAAATVDPDCITLYIKRSSGSSSDIPVGLRHWEGMVSHSAAVDTKFERGRGIGWPIPGIRFIRYTVPALGIVVRCSLLCGLFALLPLVWLWRTRRRHGGKRGFPIGELDGKHSSRIE